MLSLIRRCSSMLFEKNKRKFWKFFVIKWVKLKFLLTMYTFREFLFVFWDPWFWLPPGEKWEFLNPTDELDYADYRDLYTYPIAIGVGILVFRLGLEKFCFKRLGVSLGLKNVKNKKAPSNAVLEKAFKTCSRWTHRDIAGLSKQTDCSARQIERWLRMRKMQGKSYHLNRFSENCWLLFYYSNVIIYGLITISTKTWFWDLDYCWVNYPHQELSYDIWRYYMVSLGFYWSLLIFHFTSLERSQFWSHLCHYLTAIIVLSFTWICNLHRICCVILITHDFANVALHAGKTFKCAKCDSPCYISFCIFVISWFLTRLIYLPFWILPNVLSRAQIVIGKVFPAYHLFSGFLISLQIFYLYHTYYVLKFSLKLITRRKIHFLN